MRPPITVKDETAVVMTFSSAERAVLELEDYDIAIYTAWDAEGVGLKLSPGPRHTVTLADSGERDEAGLRLAILASFAAVGRTGDANAPLAELVTKAHESFQKDRPVEPGRLGSLISRLFSKSKASI